MGLSAAMSSVGINAEAGGSAMSRVMQKVNTAVLEGGESLTNFASIAGQVLMSLRLCGKKDRKMLLLLC